MVAELSPLEERRELLRGVRARVEARERALHVLERSLGRVPGETGARECALHARVRRDDRAPHVRVVPQVVERLVERERHRRLSALLPGPRERRAPTREHDEHGAADKGEDDYDLVPAQARIADLLAVRAGPAAKRT